MLLVVDAGNTNIVFAICRDSQIIGKWRISADAKRTADEYALLFMQLFSQKNISFDNIRAAIISNVVPQHSFPLKEVCKNYLKCSPIIVDHTINIGIKISVDLPAEVGADRLVDASAALKKYGTNVVVIDFGTATTFDVISNEGSYIGGVIAPGVNLSMEALHLAAAKLPEVAVKKPGKVVGSSTVSAMQSGIYWGYVGLIEGIIDRINKEQNSKMTVVATGGLAPLFFDATSYIHHLESDLTIEGLKYIYEINQKLKAA